MKEVDYIIVGAGYAGTFLAHHLLMQGRTFVLFSDGAKGASHVSAGMVNPAVLKKFTTFWLAQQQIDLLREVCQEIEGYTGRNYLIDEHVHRIFHDETERDLWLKKSGREDLAPFLNPDLKQFPVVLNPWKTGGVMQSCRLDVTGFFNDIHAHIDSLDAVVNESFSHAELDLENKIYHDVKFKNIIFCEGMGVRHNPYFSDIEVNANKGHHLVVKLSEPLNFGATLKKKHFLFPLENNTYYYGGTYDRDQTDHSIDEKAVEQLQNGLKEFYPHAFETEAVNYGFRPTVKDRRPIIGAHPDYNFMYVFNGLGARGVLNGCYFAKELIAHITEGKQLPAEVNANRFEK